MRKDTEFYSEGCLVKGHLYVPDDLEKKGQAPGIILCHGFAGVKELLLPAYAEAFSRSGFVVLAFDYRGFGESEGERGKLLPREQITDIRNAITFLMAQPEIEPDRLGLWGTSFGGANAIAAAAQDKRVKCLTVQLTFGDGERLITRSLSDAEKEKIYATIAKMWTRAVTQNKIMQVPVNKVLTDEQSIAFYQQMKDKFPALDIKIPFLTIKESMEHKPEKWLKDVNIPILITAAEKDAVNPLEESEILHKKANQPRELVVIKDATHYELYEGEKFQEVVDKQIDWFQNYL